MKTFFTRQNVTIILVIVLVVFVIYSRTGLEMSEGDKTKIRQYLVEHKDSLSTVPFLVYVNLKKLRVMKIHSVEVWSPLKKVILIN